MDFYVSEQGDRVLSAETVAAMNGVLSAYAICEGKISSEKHRLDTTVYETNVHYPTDSSLLWDSFRTLWPLGRQPPEGTAGTGFASSLSRQEGQEALYTFTRPQRRQ